MKRFMYVSCLIAVLLFCALVITTGAGAEHRKAETLHVFAQKVILMDEYGEQPIDSVYVYNLRGLGPNIVRECVQK